MKKPFCTEICTTSNSRFFPDDIWKVIKEYIFGDSKYIKEKLLQYYTKEVIPKIPSSLHYRNYICLPRQKIRINGNIFTKKIIVELLCPPSKQKQLEDIMEYSSEKPRRIHTKQVKIYYYNKDI